MRLLLDEGFPSPPGFDISSMDSSVEVVALRDFDSALVGVGTPDWYLYLRAKEGGFDALVTRDDSQTRQVEELWIMAYTKLSVITWRTPIEDPVREWGQILAYLPTIRRLIEEHGPSIIFLPTPRLNIRNVGKASTKLHKIAKNQGVSAQELRNDARRVVLEELNYRGEPLRFSIAQGHYREPPY